jgi:Tol biopolymer transport system component
LGQESFQEENCIFVVMKKIAAILFTACLFLQFAAAQKPDISVYKFRDSALTSTWCQYDSTLVAYDLLQPNGYYYIYLATVGAGNTLASEYCFTCGDTALPGKSVAQPCFSPDGKYLMFTAEKAIHPGSSGNSIPGIGLYNDLYLMTMDGKKTYKLINMPDTGISGMIETYFSPNGKEIMWDQMTENVALAGRQEFGYWVIKTANFIEDTMNGPHIDSSSIRTLEPGDTTAFNEPYGWSPDGSRIIFASDYNQFWVWDEQIYTMDTLGGDIEQMSSTAHSYPYTEHAFYSTDGRHIVWMTNRANGTDSTGGGDDWWIMNADTTHQERLTYFNDTACSYWTGTTHINCHGSYSPDNKKFIGDVTGSEPVQVNPALSIGAAYIITFNNISTWVNQVTVDRGQLTVYPNPACDYITMSVSNNAGELYYSIYNVVGCKMAEGEFSGNTFTLDVSDFSSGMYFINVKNGNTEANEKFAVVKK